MMRSLLHWGFLLTLIAATASGCGKAEEAPALKEVQRVHSGALDVILLSPTGALRQGKDSFVLEFRAADGQLVDAGTVNVNATMVMAGMAPMLGGSTVSPTATKGRYDVRTDLNMAGGWRFTVEWNGPAGQGSTSLAGTVS
jgi:anion-transporting  ArsA/GET3 family ATPase